MFLVLVRRQKFLKNTPKIGPLNTLHYILWGIMGTLYIDLCGNVIITAQQAIVNFAQFDWSRANSERHLHFD